MTSEIWQLSCPECGHSLVKAQLTKAEYITTLTVLCSGCLKLVKYNKGTIKADELEQLPAGQRRLSADG